MPLSISSRALLHYTWQFQATDREKTLKTFITIFVLFQLPPFIHNLMEHVKVWTIS